MKVTKGASPNTKLAGAVSSTAPPIVVEENHGFSGKIAQDLSFATLSSITTYRKDTGYNAFDSDFSRKPFLRADLYGSTKTFAQEFQLASRKSSDLTWIAGLYYLNSRAGYLPSRFTGDGIDVAAPLLGLPVGTHLVRRRISRDDFEAPCLAVIAMMTDGHGRGVWDNV